MSNNVDIVLAVTLINIAISLFTIIAVNYKYDQIKSLVNEVNGVADADVKRVKSKPTNSLFNKFKSALALDDDDLDTLFDEDEEDDEERHKAVSLQEEKDRTDEIIDLIDLYEIEMNLSHKLVEDVKAGKYNTLSKEILKQLNEKYKKRETTSILLPSTTKKYTTMPISYNTTRFTYNTNTAKKRRMFTNPQQLVDYVAYTSRMVYDDRFKTVRQVDSFSIDAYGNLLIYYDKNDAPSTFRANYFGEAA